MDWKRGGSNRKREKIGRNNQGGGAGKGLNLLRRISMEARSCDGHTAQAKRVLVASATTFDSGGPRQASSRRGALSNPTAKKRNSPSKKWKFFFFFSFRHGCSFLENLLPFTFFFPSVICTTLFSFPLPPLLKRKVYMTFPPMFKYKRQLFTETVCSRGDS